MKNPIVSKSQQKWMVRGLRKRFQLFDQRLADSSQSTVQDEARAREAHTKALEQLDTALKQERAQEVTRCDDDVDREWRTMEETTFESLKRQEKKLQKLLTDLRAKREQELKRFAKVKSDLQRDYDAVKSHPGKRFEHKKSELETLLAENEAEFDRSLQLVASRSLSVTLDEPPSEEESYGAVSAAYDAIRLQKKEIERAYQSLKRQPAARLVESFGLWALSLLIGCLAAGGAWLVRGDLLIAGGAGLGTAILSVLLLIVAARPAMAKLARREIPLARIAMMRSEKAASVARKMLELECQNEQQRLRNEFKNNLTKAEQEHESALNKMQEQLELESTQIRQKERQIREAAAKSQTEHCKAIQQQFKPHYESLLAQQSRRKEQTKRSHEESLHALHRNYRDGLAFIGNRVKSAIRLSNQIAKGFGEEIERSFPSWSDPTAWNGPKLLRKNPMAVVPVGTLRLELGSEASEPETKERLQFHQSMPLVFRLIEDGSLVIETDSPHARQAAQNLVKNVLLRALTSLPAGQFQTTIIDPDGLGKDYSWLMHLADADPRMVNYRVWTQNNHIAEQLAKLSHHTEDVIQQLLRDRYPDLRAYNRDAGSMAEAYRIVVWSRFPVGLDENSWKSLCSLMSSGGRCGVSVIILSDSTVQWPFMADAARLREAGLYLQLRTDPSSNQVEAKVVDSDWSDFALQLAEPPQDGVLNQVLERSVEEALQGNRVEVPFDTILPPAEAQGQGNSAEGLGIPLGQAGIGRSLQLRLGLGTAQHVLIAGKTGSGKSSLLHTMISSAVLKYAPDQLRLVLLDFKKGVEFQVYAEAGLPHADIIGIESQREFGLSALEHLDRVMQKRGEMFREAGVQDVASWVRKRPERPMPRILVVVDEFQELFVEDDKLAQQAAMLLDRVVRQGRSFGIHVVLASQTLGGSYSLPRTTLAQMAVRIALQCEGADAMMILSEDNLAAERLRHAGQAIYNDASGRVEGNQPFQVAYISKSDQMAKLASIPPAQPFEDESNNSLGRCVVFEGHKAAHWDTAAAEAVLERMTLREATAIGSVIGDSVSIEPAVTIPWSRQAGRNLLLVGSEDRNAANCLAALIASLSWSGRRRLGQRPKLYFLDGSRPDDVHAAALPKWIGKLDGSRLGDVRSAESLIAELHQELVARMDKPDELAQPIFLTVAQLARFRELRKSEEFSFGEDSGGAKPDQQLQAILRDGPTHGVHSILWADNWNTISRWLPRQSLHDLELRVLMQMSANDSNHLIDSPIGNRLDAHVLLLHDEASGISRKFRPYRMEDPEALWQWLQ